MEKLFAVIPKNVLVGSLVFVVLLFAGYFAGHTQALSSRPATVIGASHGQGITPFYLTDPSGSNAVTVNRQGHMSVHIADPNLPVVSGPNETARLTYPGSSGLSTGQCYVAFVRGAGTFLTAQLVDNKGTGAGRPDSLVRLDRGVVWIEDKSANSSSTVAASGVTKAGSSLVFGYGYSLKFVAFAGVDVCWHHPGVSDGFSVVLTVAGLAGEVLDPEQMTFSLHTGPNGEKTFSWSHEWLQNPGNKPVAYRLAGTNSDLVRYYKRIGSPQVWQPYGTTYTETLTADQMMSPKEGLFRRFYVFEAQAASDPTRVGPFGNWSGL